jgi:hypothetical protein
MNMNQNQINKISEEIYRRFPEVNGKKPQVNKRQFAKKRSILRSNTYSLTYRGQSKTLLNKTIPFYVRAIVNENGKILKITMSH